MTNIFVSYARKDSKALAMRLRDDLMRVGLSVWLDLREIELGGNFTEDIERAIDDCDVALVLMSDGASQSQWCRMEQLRALRKGKKVIPLRAQSHTEPPLHLEHLNFIDFSDDSHYEGMFRDLISDISASQAFRPQRDDKPRKDSPYKAVTKGGRTPSDTKRNAPAFRRHIRNLRAEEWLGLRSWWTYFLFQCTDMDTLVRILKANEVTAPFIENNTLKSQWDRFVRFHFRPRNPDLFHAEGFISATRAPEQHTPMPVYMLFDMEALLLHPQARFSDGDPLKGHSTYATPSAFGELPFEMIYHDSWMRKHESEEIIRYREAQVLLPERVGLEALQLIWVRSSAEYETLHQLLGADLWRKWREKITARTDFSLFNHKRPYVHRAHLSADSVQLIFNPCQMIEETDVYLAQLHITYSDGTQLQWEQQALNPAQDVWFNLPARGGYEISLLLDGHLAYTGVYQAHALVL